MAGAAIGSAVCPIPGLGVVVGKRVGSYAGRRIGRRIGSSVYKTWTGYNEQANTL